MSLVGSAYSFFQIRHLQDQKFVFLIHLFWMTNGEFGWRGKKSKELPRSKMETKSPKDLGLPKQSRMRQQVQKWL
jgi:hypothetical protein